MVTRNHSLETEIPGERWYLGLENQVRLSPLRNGIVSDILAHPSPFFRSNLAHGRYIPRGDDYKIRAHRTVKLRMDAEDKLLPEGRRYEPRAKPWERHRVEWVD